MIGAVDVHYQNDRKATVAAVMFKHWEQENADFETVLKVEDVKPYVPGEFYRRELPCILSVVERIQMRFDALVVDGYVYLGENEEPGLGWYLWEALGRSTPVIGVAKTKFKNVPGNYEVFRGKSHRPLYVSSVGVSLSDAQEFCRSMHGKSRIPTLLRRVDKLSRDIQPR